jgi:hypothetical protein
MNTHKYRLAKNGIEMGIYPAHSMAMQVMCIDSHKSGSPLTDYALTIVTVK